MRSCDEGKSNSGFWILVSMTAVGIRKEISSWSCSEVRLLKISAFWRYQKRVKIIKLDIFWISALCAQFLNSYYSQKSQHSQYSFALQCPSNYLISYSVENPDCSLFWAAFPSCKLCHGSTVFMARDYRGRCKAEGFATHGNYPLSFRVGNQKKETTIFTTGLYCIWENSNSTRQLSHLHNHRSCTCTLKNYLQTCLVCSVLSYVPNFLNVS